MALKVYNTLTRQKADFVPIDPKNVRMYVCGPTVYDFAHIGNARPVIVFDLLFRLLRFLFGPDHVTYVRNITDVDDKINARAARDYPDLPLNDAIRKVTEATEAQFHKDTDALGVLPPTYEPRATEYIRRPEGGEDMISLIDKLVANGHAYVAEDHVLFDVASMPDYGRLSNRSLDEMEAGARVEVAPYKKGPMDFVLWKPSKPGEPAWRSPAGITTPGRPGWHIECSAMAGALLGPVFDIHGGGIDLTFPHHENEIAQSRCAHETPVMANVWMHNGFLQVEGEKMSKSLGNFVTINELLATQKFGGRIWPGEVLRWAMLMTHYREPINWSVERLTEARNELANWSEAVIEDASYPYSLDDSSSAPSDAVLQALEDDLNTPLARTHLQKLYKRAEADDLDAKRVLCRTMQWLGIFRAHLQPAYSISPPVGEGTDASNGRAPPIIFLSKYKDTALDARAIILNRYRWDSTDANEREKSRLAVETEINALNPAMREDGVGFKLGEHCDLSIVLIDKRERDTDDVEQLIIARLEARKRKDFKESDRIRDELASMGITLKDSKNKETGEIETTWEVAR